MKKQVVSGLLTLALLFSLFALPGVQASEAAPYAFVETVVSIPNGDHDIPATIVMPQGAEGETFPVVVMCHGYGSNRDEAGGGYQLFAPMLAAQGIASIRFDVMGCGESTADYAQYTFKTAQEDALRCTQYMTEQQGIDPNRIGLMGWSMGGGIAMMTASESDLFKSVCTWAGALYDGDYNAEEYEIAKKDGFFEVTFDWRDSLRQGPGYYEVAAQTHLPAMLPNCKAPIFAINGSLDDVVPPESGATIVVLSANDASKALVLEGADHTFNIFSGDMTQFNALMSATLDWFVQTL